MNKKYHLFGKIPVVDVLIVLVLVLVVSACVFFLTRGAVQEQTGAQAQQEKIHPFEAVFCVENIKPNNYEAVEVGDKLYLDDGTYVATITKKEIKPHLKFSFDSKTAQPVTTQMDGRFDLFITVKGEATARDDNGILINKKRIAYNNRISLGNEKYYWGMLTVDITREEA